MRMFGSLKHGGDKSPLAGGPHYLFTSLEVFGVWGEGVRQSAKIIIKKRIGATEKRKRGSDGWESWRLRVVSEELDRGGMRACHQRGRRRLVRLLLLLFSQTDERPACWETRCRDVILKPNMSCAGVSRVMWVHTLMSVRSGMTRGSTVQFSTELQSVGLSHLSGVKPAEKWLEINQKNIHHCVKHIQSHTADGDQQYNNVWCNLLFLPYRVPDNLSMISALPYLYHCEM